jgi:hypothetical protein
MRRAGGRRHLFIRAYSVRPRSLSVRCSTSFSLPGRRAGGRGAIPLFARPRTASSLHSIPLSLLAAVIVLDRFGVSLNTITLGGFAIAIGVVVDDAIIDVENILRRLRENVALAEPRPVWRVVLDASLEVRSAVVYATFIVALVFVPVLAMGGIGGRPAAGRKLPLAAVARCGAYRHARALPCAAIALRRTANRVTLAN